MDYPGKNTHKKRYSLCSHLYLLKIISGFEIDLLHLHMTLNLQTNNRNRLSRQHKMKKMYYTCFYLKIYLLALNMILNHHNISEKYSPVKHTPIRGIALVPSFI